MTDTEINTIDNLPAVTEGHAGRDLHIAKLRLSGMTMPEIADQVGLTHQRVSQILSQDHVRSVIADTLQSLSLAAPQVGHRLLGHIEQDDDDNRSLKAIDTYSKIIGIASPHASIYVQNMMINNNTAVISSEMSDLLASKRVDRDQDADIIDVVSD